MADFNGTPGPDNLQGTAGDDLFEAWAGTFSAGDVADGGDGDDTLVAFGSIDFTGVSLSGFEFLSFDFDHAAAPPAAITLTFTAAQAAAGFSPNLFVAGSPTADQIVIRGSAGVALDLSGWVLSPAGAGETLIYQGAAGQDELTIGTLSGAWRISLGAGTDILALGGTVGQFRAADAIVVTDFQAGPGGDELKLDAFLDSAMTGRASGQDPFASGHLRLQQNGADAVLLADANGGGDNLAPLLTLKNLNALALTPENLGGYASGLSTPAPLAGGPAPDVLTGGAGDDHLQGRDGDDTLRGGGGSDLIDGGAGFDIALYSAAYRAYAVGLGGASVAGGPEGGADALTGVERLQFVDGYFSTDASAGGTAASVYRLYQTMLNRAPDSAGLASWVQAIDFKGSSLKAVADGFLGSSEFNGTYGALSNTAFVELMYANVLHRASDLGRGTWINLLDRGGSRAEVAIGFSQSGENIRNLADALQQGVWVGDPNAGVAARFYDTVFSRRPDSGGLDTWTKALNAGVSLQSVANGFVASSEFQAAYGSLDNDQFVELMYRNVLGRSSDADGKANWLDALARGGTRADVVVGFSESAEHVRLLAPRIDDGVWVA